MSTQFKFLHQEKFIHKIDILRSSIGSADGNLQISLGGWTGDWRSVLDLMQRIFIQTEQPRYFNFDSSKAFLNFIFIFKIS